MNVPQGFTGLFTSGKDADIYIRVDQAGDRNGSPAGDRRDVFSSTLERAVSVSTDTAGRAAPVRWEDINRLLEGAGERSYPEAMRRGTGLFRGVGKLQFEVAVQRGYVGPLDPSGRFRESDTECWWGMPYIAIATPVGLDPGTNTEFKPGTSCVVFEISPETAREYSMSVDAGQGMTHRDIPLSRIRRAWAVRVESRESFWDGLVRMTEIRLPGMAGSVGDANSDRAFDGAQRSGEDSADNGAPAKPEAADLAEEAAGPNTVKLRNVITGRMDIEMDLPAQTDGKRFYIIRSPQGPERGYAVYDAGSHTLYDIYLPYRGAGIGETVLGWFARRCAAEASDITIKAIHSPAMSRLARKIIRDPRVTNAIDPMNVGYMILDGSFTTRSGTDGHEIGTVFVRRGKISGEPYSNTLPDTLTPVVRDGRLVILDSAGGREADVIVFYNTAAGEEITGAPVVPGFTSHASGKPEAANLGEEADGVITADPAVMAAMKEGLERHYEDACAFRLRVHDGDRPKYRRRIEEIMSSFALGKFAPGKAVRKLRESVPAGGEGDIRGVFDVALSYLIKEGRLDALKRFTADDLVLREFGINAPAPDDAVSADTLYFLESVLAADPATAVSLHGRNFRRYDPSLRGLNSIRTLLDLRSDLGTGLSAAALGARVRNLLANEYLEDRWTALNRLPDGREISTALFYLLLLAGHECRSQYTNAALSPGSIANKAFVRKDDRRIFLRKLYEAEPVRDRGGYYAAHPDLNNPYREKAAYHIGRAFGVNTAEAAIGPDGATFSCVYAADERPLIPRKTGRAAESAGLVFNVLVRKFDDTKDMINRSPAGDTFVLFDHDNAFHPARLGMKRFLKESGYLRSIREQHWAAEDFDPAVIWETIRRIREFDFESLRRMLGRELGGQAVSPMGGRQRVNAVNHIIRYIMKTRKTIESDVAAYYRALTGEDLPSPGNTKPEAANTGAPSPELEPAGVRVPFEQVSGAGCEIRLFSGLVGPEYAVTIKTREFASVAKLVREAQEEVGFWRGWDERSWPGGFRDAMVVFEKGEAVAIWAFIEPARAVRRDDLAIKRFIPSYVDVQGDGLYVARGSRGNGLAGRFTMELLRHLSESQKRVFRVGWASAPILDAGGAQRFHTKMWLDEKGGPRYGVLDLEKRREKLVWVEIDTGKFLEAAGAAKPEPANLSSSEDAAAAKPAPHADGPDLAREARIARDLWDAVAVRAIAAKWQGRSLILGLDTRWIGDKSGPQALVSQLRRLEELGRRRGVRIVFRDGEGDALAKELEGERARTGAAYSDIIVLGDRSIADEGSAFLDLRGSDPGDSALLAGVDSSRLTKASAVRLYEMYLLALMLDAGAADSALDQTFIKIMRDPKGRSRIFIFTPIEPYDVGEFRKVNELMVRELESKA